MKKYLLLFLIVSLQQLLVHAELPPALQTNGCGSSKGWSAILVPNNTIISGCKFEASCNKHDICYGKCLKGGPLFGNPTCEDEAAKVERRKACDQDLRNNIAQENSGRSVCGMYASIYHWAVVNFGADSFKGIASSNPNAIALNAFLEYVANNPTVFDNEELRTAFEVLNNDEYSSGFVVAFTAYIPEIRVAAYDENSQKYVPVLIVKGNKNKGGL